MSVHSIKKRLQMRKMKRKDQGRRKGFTLVEIVVVLALIAILASFSAGAMLGYTRFAVFKRNNENARTVFSAAQSAITYYKASGRLKELRRSVEALPQSPAYVPAAAFEADQELMENETDGRRNSTISYLILSKEYYDEIREEIRANSAAEVKTADEQTNLLFELLRDYITDVSIYNATICVEFDATDGVVSGVLYCDSAKNFSYGPSAGAMDITDREESHREDIGLGYYSTALSERAPQEVGDLEIAAAELKNAETLDVQWFLEKQYQYLKGTLDYTVDIYEQEGVGTPVKRASISLPKEQVQGISVESGENAQVKPESVTLYAEDGTAYELVKDGVVNADSGGGEMAFHAFLASDEKYGDGYALSLDVLDTYLAEAMESGELSDRQAEMMRTYSARRLSFDMEDKHYGLDLSGTKKIQAEVSITQKPGGESTEFGNLLFADGAVENRAESGAAALYAYEYEIANARHLYNVRFREQEIQAEAAAGTVDSAVYKIVNDFAWGGPDGILSFTDQTPAGGTASGIEKPEGNLIKVFEQGEIIALAQDSSYPVFPSIRSLGEKSTILSAHAESSAGSAGEGEPAGGTSGAADPDGEDVIFTIGYLALEPETETVEGELRLADNVGLVQENRGTIRNLNLSDVDVRGIRRTPEEEEPESMAAADDPVSLSSAKNTGAFCGVNNGTLEKVQTVSGYVTGGENVGGIAGVYGDAPGVSAIAELKNGAQVSGLKHVGGIVGSVTDRAVSDCENTGIVYGYALPETAGTLDGKTPEEVTPVFIGGIVGSAAGDSAISGCVSSPAPQKGAPALTAEELETMLAGNYVGGIAGYLSGSAGIDGCAVGAETEAAGDGTSAGTEGDGAAPEESGDETAAFYVLGDSFVGGIAGANGGDGNIAANAENGRNISSALVVGRRFVGGIVGANGRIGTDVEETDPRMVTHRDFQEISGSTVTGWRCTGFTVAVGKEQENGGEESGQPDGADGTEYPSYAGGIAGANMGNIENCTVEQSGEMPEELEALTGAGADYTGGVAGYNGGTLLAGEESEPLQITQVKGRNFVGGVAGYNDGASGQGKIENYALSDASVEGGNFVGGFVGLNTSADLLTDEDGAVSLPERSAESVRGRSYVGGFAGANMIEKSLTVTVSGTGIGSVAADCAFVGGLFGYSRILPEGGAKALFKEDGSGIADQLLEASGQNPAEEDGEQPAMTQEQLNELVRRVLALDAADTPAAGAALTITGTEDAGAGSSGAEDDENSGQIEGQLFVGGVLGYHAADSALKISRYTVEASVTATGAATAEEFDRYGTDAEGNPKRYSFSGGILGYVTRNTILDNCRVNGTVETAGTYAGGLAEVNEGQIVSCAAAAMSAERNNVGGVAGLNGFSYEADGTTRAAGILQSCAVPEGTEVHGAGIVGGLAAENMGVIRAESTGTGSEVEGGGTVSASASYAGGLAGVNRGTIENMQGVSVHVNAPDAQYVGGIAGLNEGGILGVSTGSGTTVTGGSCAGGIAGLNRTTAERENSGRISDNTRGTGETAQTFACVSQAEVTAAATAGGIVGENAGSIIRTMSQGSVQAGGQTLGGVAGANEGVIELGAYPLAQDLELKSAGADYIGGIAGVNNAGAVIRKAEAGQGVADTGYAQISAALRDDGAAHAAAAMGGAAGSNAGTIRQVRFVGTLDGCGGRQEEPDGGTAEGDGDDADPSAYGGIAGINDGIISECGLGLDTDNAESPESAPKEAAVRAVGENYLGGIAGWNRKSASITGIVQEAAKPNRAKVLISSEGALATGGIAGVNEGEVGVSGDAESTDVETGANWRIAAGAVERKGVDEDGDEYEYLYAGPTGGIIGIQRGTSLSGLVNNAGTYLPDGPAAGESGEREVAGVYSEGGIAGGIAGSVESGTDADGSPTESAKRIAIQDCRNLGPVTSAGRAGGILGVWASGADGAVTGCANGRTSEPDQNPAEDAGDLCAVITIEENGNKTAGTDRTAAAGIVGGFDGLASGQVISVQACENFGICTGASGAGIAVLADGMCGEQEYKEEEGDGTAGTKIRVDDCVNAGRIARGAGLVLTWPDDVRNVQLALTRSRNYGRPADGDDGSFAGLLACASGDGEDAALFTDYASLSETLEGGQIEIQIQNCIGVADVTYPTVPMEAAEEERAEVFASLKTLFAGKNNYYYSAKDEQPFPVGTAGIGSAVYHGTGAYQNAYETSAHNDREDLRAVNALAEDGGTFDPNGQETVSENVFRNDCRGNYNRLDAALREACKKDMPDEPEQKILPLPELSVCLTDAAEGMPVYGLRLDNFEAYQEFNMENPELALRLEAKPLGEASGTGAAGIADGTEETGGAAGTQNAQTCELRIPLAEFAEGNLYILQAEQPEMGNAAGLVQDADLTLGIEAWVEESTDAGGAQDGAAGETGDTDSRDSEWQSDRLVEPNVLLPGADSLALMPEEVEIIAETAEGDGNAEAARTYTFTGAGADYVVYRVEVLESFRLDESDILLDTAVASALLQGGQSCTLTGGPESVARIYPTEVINGSVKVILSRQAASGLDLSTLRGGAEGASSYIVAEDDSFRPGDGYDIEAVRQAGEEVYSGFNVYAGLFLKAGSPFAACVFDPDQDLQPSGTAMIGGDLFFEEVILPPQKAQLSANWALTCGEDPDGRSLAMPEKLFRDQVTVTASETEGSGTYLMCAGFYTDAPEDVRALLEEQAAQVQAGMAGDTGAVPGGGPDSACLIAELADFDGQTPLAMNGGSYTFRGLTAAYGGAYLCVRFCSVLPDRSGMSEWSDYLWMRMPKVLLETEGVTQTSVKTEHTMTVTDRDGVVSGIETTELSHPAITWKQELPDGAEVREADTDAVNAGDSGWRIELYDFLDGQTSAESKEYDRASLTVDLLRDEGGNGYRIERALTEKEQEQWREEHPEEQMPEYLHVSLPVEEDAALYESEYKLNDRLKKAWTVTLDERVLGTDSAGCDYAQVVDGVGGRAIETVYPQIRILEYRKDTESGAARDYVRYILILPDVEQDAPFLIDYTAILRTHSATVEPLFESRFRPQKEGMEARRVQYTYLRRKDSGEKELRSYLRTLDAGQTINEKFDIQTEKEKNGFADAEQYELMPRNYAEEIARQTGDALLMQQKAERQETGETESEQDGLFFEEDVQPDTTPQTEDSTEGTEAPEDPEVGISTELLTEPQTQETAEEQTQVPTEAQTQETAEAQTQASTEAQTQAPTEAQTQASTEAQTQAATEEQTQAPAAAQTVSEKTEDVILEDAVGLGVFDRGWGI